MSDRVWSHHEVASLVLLSIELVRLERVCEVVNCLGILPLLEVELQVLGQDLVDVADVDRPE